MTNNGQEKTRSTYENEQIVRGYIKKHAKNPKIFPFLETFAKTIPGRRVIDIGCGPGHDAYRFAELGFSVTAIDYSKKMIAEARKFKSVKNPPSFGVMDMRKVGDEFQEDSFDGAWVCDSLLHVPEKDVPAVLQGLRKIVVKGGRVFIGLKGGPQGAITVREKKYGKTMEREFIFWEKANFQQLAEGVGLRVVDFSKPEGGVTGGIPTPWLDFQLEVVK